MLIVAYSQPLKELKIQNTPMKEEGVTAPTSGGDFLLLTENVIRML